MPSVFPLVYIVDPYANVLTASDLVRTALPGRILGALIAKASEQGHGVGAVHASAVALA